MRIIARKPHCGIGMSAHMDSVAVTAGEQRGAGERAERRRVEIGIAKTRCGELVQAPRVNQPPTRTEMRKAGAVDHPKQHLRRALPGGGWGGPSLPSFSPPLGPGPTDG